MADTQSHAAQARKYLAYADELIAREPSIAGEICWGAAIQAAQAYTHARGHAVHQQSYGGITDAIRQLPAGQSIKSYWLKTEYETVAILHGGFYRPETINPERHADTIIDSRRLVIALISAAQN